MRLEKLQYQRDAIDAALAAIQPGAAPGQPGFANPPLPPQAGIDVKMETGTGKTYVYTRLMHQLRQRFGLFKFIIVVPSLAIKEGVKMSIASDEWRRHFRQEFGHQNISLGVINSGDFATKKGKRKQIPEALRSFCEGSDAEKNTIHALLLNDEMLDSGSMSRDDYDTTLFDGITCPLEALKNTRPIVIIDEPHRFKKENKAWRNITGGLAPRLIIRFGATFPDQAGRGGGKEDERLVYDLNSVRAFNEGLVKGVKIEYPDIPGTPASGEGVVKYKVKTIHKKEGVVFAREGKLLPPLKIGERLATLDAGFGDVALESIASAQSATLSNELELCPGMELLPQVFGMGYQELMMRQALEEHFAIERANFHRTAGDGRKLPRVKTNSLFFIDSVSAFRGTGENRKGWLRERFETLLAEKLREEIKRASGDYRDFLTASLSNVGQTMAGYFAEDNTRKADEALQAEVAAILRDKEQTLRFKNADHQWNTRRFFFSKWALCEGWDNPNVFVICKLRSSGSEIRKIQEVGRGLRLPFDETGARLATQSGGEDFRLSYIIDFSEREFAQKLVGEINADGAGIAHGKIHDGILKELVKAGYAATDAKAKARLLNEDIIDAHDTILDAEKLLALLPADSGVKLKQGVITGSGLPERPTIRLNKGNFQKLKSLWEQVTRRYVLKFEPVDEAALDAALGEIFGDDKIFEAPVAQVVTHTLAKAEEGEGVALHVDHGMPKETALGVLPYGPFLTRLSRRTALPVARLHRHIVAARRGKETPQNLFNAQTLERVCGAFERVFRELFAQKFSYAPLEFHAQTSLFTPDGDFVAEMKQGLVGGQLATDIRVDTARYLYDKAAYDSKLEHEVLRVTPPPEVIVYGKLPRRSIQLPTYTGGTTSPDFVYAIREPAADGERVRLHLMVETKSEAPHLTEQVAIEAQRQFFQQNFREANIIWEMETSGAHFGELLHRHVRQGP